ncbi:hypothetical protein OESDEN_05930 [Oesophagostomum dentatum]|uniref:Saposin B-type domain-containing protein n=1 Tax=Oesophagostomum dentatum TaxID=61180 RepID=A0A0B1TFL3_OESDE|nr:hypothetical protein OESDEN_05930 [Oesophagostomum dentatum]
MNFLFVVAFTTMLCGAVSGQYEEINRICSDPQYYTICRETLIDTLVNALASEYLAGGFGEQPSYDQVDPYYG